MSLFFQLRPCIACWQPSGQHFHPLACACTVHTVSSIKTGHANRTSERASPHRSSHRQDSVSTTHILQFEVPIDLSDYCSHFRHLVTAPCKFGSGRRSTILDFCGPGRESAYPSCQDQDAREAAVDGVIRGPGCCVVRSHCPSSPSGSRSGFAFGRATER